MAPSAEPDCRILALGNEMLGDDAFACMVARRVEERSPGIRVTCSPANGFHLIDDLLGGGRLVVVATAITGQRPVGTIYVVRESSLCAAPGNSQHFKAVLEAVATARALGLDAPREVLIIAVEATDCLTLGGAMHPAVEAAVQVVAGLVESAFRSKNLCIAPHRTFPISPRTHRNGAHDDRSRNTL